MTEFLFTIAIMALCFCAAVTGVALVAGVLMIGYRKIAEAAK